MKKIVAVILLIAVFLISCSAPPEVSPTSTPKPTITKVPPTSTAIPSTSTPLPPARTPFPASCTPSDSTVLEVINAFETLANEKNLEGTMGLFADNAVFEESFRGVLLEGFEEIESLWRGYYRSSLPCEFRDIILCGNNATFIWAELGAASSKLWPVLIEVKDGKISYMDFYENATRESIGDE
jgi:hypothetical protein